MPSFDRLHTALTLDEATQAKLLLEEIKPSAEKIAGAKPMALALAQHVRKVHENQGGMDSFMQTYDLSSKEGIALMCLAEALLRIPDGATADRLIADKISKGDWENHLGNSDSLFVNVATMGLLLTGKVINDDPMAAENWTGSLKGWFSRTSEPIIRQAVSQAMKILGKQYVLGETIEAATKRAATKESEGFTYSYDMLGESARTAEHADNYFNAYAMAIHAIGKNSRGKGLIAGPGISIKLSALHPRYEFAQWDDQFEFLLPRLLELLQLAKSYNIGVTIDAEETDRLELSLALFKAAAEDPSLQGWEGLGLAVQAYQKRARAVLDWLKDLSIASKRKLMVRLVKGAYWDSEIKHAQISGYPYYPVYTRKMTTDVSYLACAQKLLDNPQHFYPQFATHNAFTVSAIMAMVKPGTEFEFQRLHGMGEALYDKVLKDNPGLRCRIYAPVGGHQYLLAYLVRRLLENGANTSFVNQVVSADTPIEDLIANPIEKLSALHCKPHPKIKLPRDLYQADRVNSQGVDLMETHNLTTLENQLKAHYPAVTAAVGKVQKVDVDAVAPAMKKASVAYESWSRKTLQERADILNAMADKLEEHQSELIAIAVKEAGKTIPNAIGEIREAVDFCRYYAAQGLKTFLPVALPGPTGEYNQLSYRGRGVMVCISPWNFPLAIFTGQLAAALMAGNTVLAKPAEQTSLMAQRAVELFHKAGVPQDALQLMPGKGSTVGSAMVAHPDVAGVIFTGSTEVAQFINQTLAAKNGPIVPLIAETGGQNTMIVDSTALLEQVVMDVVKSAFDSAGQRCSALRILCVQEDVADDLIHMIKGHMDTLKVGDPSILKTDVGPVIDANAQRGLLEHIETMRAKGFSVYQTPGTPDSGCYVPPTLIEIDNLSTLKREVFGPILHVVRYSANKLTQLIQDINSTGYGLTFGMHSRNESQYHYVVSRVNIGNAYINRNIVGAVVGVQPFGGEGLSGTGPKAGGPNYMMRLVHEHALSINTVAMGGNASLLSLSDDEDLA